MKHSYLQNKLVSFEHMLQAAKKNIHPECLRIAMLLQDVILQSKDIYPRDSRTVLFLYSWQSNIVKCKDHVLVNIE